MKGTTEHTIEQAMMVIAAIAIVTILAIPSVEADAWETPILRYNLEGDYSDWGSIGKNASASGSGNTFNTTTKMINSSSLTGVGTGCFLSQNSTGLPTGNTPLTIAFWIMINYQPNPIDYYMATIGNIAGQYKGYKVAYAVDAPYKICAYNIANDVCFAYTLQNGIWYHITMAYNSANRSSTMYINGTATASSAHAGNMNLDYTGTAGISGMCNVDGTGAPTNATIDDLRYYNVLLNDGNITALFNYRESSGAEVTDILTTAVDKYNSTADTSFTIQYHWTNGTLQNVTTTNGTAPVSNVSDTNITINITYFDEQGQYYNETTYNQLIEANETNNVQLAITPITSDYYIQINATDIYEGTKIMTFTANINGTNKTTTAGNIDTGIAKDNNNEFNIIMYSANYKTKTYTDYNASADGNLTAIMTPSATYYLYIYAYNWLGTELISSVTISENKTGTNLSSNPFQNNIEYYTNESVNSSVNISITDGTYKHVDYTGAFTITPTNRNISINMTPNKLSLTFYKNGTLNTTSGYVTDESKRMDFQNSTILIVQQNLTEGYVQVGLNNINTTTNYTQFYEYINNFETNIDEDIELIQKADWYTVFQIVDYSNSPIKDVSIRCSYAYRRTLDVYYDKLLIGQRLTNDNGMTEFWGDTGSTLICTFTKDEYESESIMILVGETNYDEDNPLTIWLKYNTSSMRLGTWVTSQMTFTNETGIPIKIFSPLADLVQYTTSYRLANGLVSLVDITSTGDILDRYSRNLTLGTDYTTETFYLYVYVDGDIVRNLTIEYDNETKFEILPVTHLNETEERAGLVLLIIMFTLIPVGMFKSTNAGMIGFIAGTIVASMWNIVFIWALLPLLLYILARLVLRKYLED